MKHIPVLLDAVKSTLGEVHNRTIVDCTFGAGGYSRAFLEAGANVIAFDRDSSVLDNVMVLEKEFKDRFKFVNKPFSEIKFLDENIDDIVFDLGISSMQIDTAERGFSFRFDAPLDMRMNFNTDITAAELISTVSEENLADILYNYGDIKKSHSLAHILKEHLPKTTFQLKDLIKNTHDIAPVFQALRIAVNDEMNQLEQALQSCDSLLHTGGRCICVTFHSLEDRIVKNTFKQWCSTTGDPRMPIVDTAKYKLLKTVTPSDIEIENNIRARSSHMRGVEKL